MFSRLFLCLLLLSATATVRAEHRVALLIGNSAYNDVALASPSQNVRKVQTALEKYGFACRIVENLNSKQLKPTLEQFVEATPTRGTALVYFSGHVVEARDKDRKTLVLTATDANRSRPERIGQGGFEATELLKLLNARGGSSTNVVLIDGPADLLQPKDSPPGLIAAVTAETLVRNLTGSGEMLAQVQAASQWSVADLEAKVSISGKGSSTVSLREQFALGQQPGDEWVNERGMVFCWCPAGRFTKGSPPDEPGRYPDEEQVEVIVEDGFWIGKYELTLRESMRKPFGNRSIATNKNHPVTELKRVDYAKKMLEEYTKSERKAGRLPSGWEYALPTEEQWEYAARAGTNTAWYFGNDVTLLPEHGNFGDKTYYQTLSVYAQSAHRTLDDGVVKMAIVGSYQPNPWGLHDIHGNVAEYCWNPTPGPRGSFALRGGGWASTPEYCRCAFHNRLPRDRQTNFAGYRVVIRKPLPEPEKKSKK